MKTRNNRYKYLLQSKLFYGFIILLLLVNGCVTTYDTISTRDFTKQYMPDGQPLHPEYFLFSPFDSVYRLYFRFYPKELAYTNGPDSVSRAFVSLFFRITNSSNSTEILDSLTTSFQLTGNPRAQYLGFVPVQFPGDGHYYIEVFLTDRISNRQTSTIIETDICKENQSTSFMLTTLHGNPLFRPFIQVGDSFRIRSDKYEDTTIRVSFFKPDSIIPAPPDFPDESLLKILKADTNYSLSGTDTVFFYSKKPGIWLFTGNDQLTGKTFLCTNRYFPYTKTPESLLEPLGYLCTPKEFRHYKSLPDPKTAVDSFWLNTTDDLDQARELIRVYYSRVQLANFYFSAFREGWKTDMGMIYIVCGLPDNVKKSTDSETWIYGNGKGVVEFYFFKEWHPQFGNIYRLQRSDSLSRFWFTAVSTWCDGRIFSINP